MSIRRVTAYLGLLIGVGLLVWAGFVRYPVQQSTSVNGYSIVREAAKDGLVRDAQGRLVKRQQAKPNAKDNNACPT